ncbi:MAG: hypothetical protein PSV13_14175 [Lacunisphaera sp.]|nr:hypothetical protein [Lacunisphaera sp.]
MEPKRQRQIGPLSGTQQVIFPAGFTVEMTCAEDSSIAQEGFRQFATVHDPLRAKTRFRVPLTLIGRRKMRWIRNILVVLFAAGIAVIFLGVIEAQAPWWVNAIMIGIALLAVVPAIAFICGIQWCRFVVAAMALLFLLFWPMSPLAQHAIDRHAAFWIFWALIEALTLGAIWASLKKADPAATDNDRAAPGRV